MKGYWRVGEENVRIRTWAVGYFECKICETVLGIHDDSANFTNIRQVAGEKLIFENEEKKRKFLSRKWNPASMKAHCCESVGKVESACGSLIETPNAGSSSKRKRRFVGSNEISTVSAKSLKDFQTLWGIEHNIPAVAFDSPLFYQWLDTMIDIMKETDHITQSENFVLGHTGFADHGKNLHSDFKIRMGKLLTGQIPGYTCFYALSTDAWTSKDNKAYSDCSMRLIVVHKGVGKIYTVTLELMELGMKESEIQYDHIMD